MAYKVKPPKCSCEFWRRERRVKKAPNEEIVSLKYEMGEIRKAINSISQIHQGGSARARELGLIMSGARADIKSIAQVTTIDSTMKQVVKQAEKNFNDNQRDRFWLSMGVHYLRELYHQKHLRCLEIRNNERKGINS